MIEFTPEKPSKTTYLHEHIFTDLPKQETPVIDHHGIMWVGKDRKGLNAPNPKDLWLAWQKSVQFAAGRPGVVRPDVMGYFQKTKGFDRPPKNGEVEMQPEQPRFTWSPSKLSQFETCPYQFAAQNYYKTLPRTETAATIWGTRVHAYIENQLKDHTQGFDAEIEKLTSKWVQAVSKVKGARFIEHQMGVDENLKPCAFDGAEGRMVLDFGVKFNDELLLVDWKTGKQKDDETQLRIYALIMAIMHPDVKKVTYKYVWLKDGVSTGGTLLRSELVPVAKELKAKIEAMKAAWRDENFPKKKNGLCRAWCGVTECPHRGK